MAIGVGSIVFTAVAALIVFTARSFVALGNYNDLDRYSRNALDVLSREIRQTQGVVMFQTNQLRFRDWDGQTNLTYIWNASSGILTRQKGNAVSILLTNCDDLCFGIYQRNPSNSFNFYPTNNVTDAKLVDVRWVCSRKILGAKLNTESVQNAKIVIRN